MLLSRARIQSVIMFIWDNKKALNKPCYIKGFALQKSLDIKKLLSMQRNSRLVEEKAFQQWSWISVTFPLFRCRIEMGVGEASVQLWPEKCTEHVLTDSNDQQIHRGHDFGCKKECEHVHQGPRRDETSQILWNVMFSLIMLNWNLSYGKSRKKLTVFRLAPNRGCKNALIQ